MTQAPQRLMTQPSWSYALLEIAFTKTVVDINGGEVQVGDRLRYTLAVNNRGNGAATNLTVIDPIPMGLQNIEPLDGGQVDGNRVVWPALARLEPSMEAREFRFEATVDRALSSGDQVVNQAQLIREDGPLLVSDDPHSGRK